MNYKFYSSFEISNYEKTLETDTNLLKLNFTQI